MTEAFELPFTVRQGGRDGATFAKWQETFEALEMTPEIRQYCDEMALVSGLEDETAPWEITVIWRIEPDTRSAEPVAVSANWRPHGEGRVSAEGWRTANIGAAIRETRHRLQYVLGRMETEATDAVPFTAAHGALDEPRKSGRPADYGTDHYDAVARIYNEALKNGERNPVRIVAERMAASLNDASLTSGNDKRAKYWVRRARQRGLLQGTPDRGRPKSISN